MSRSALIVLSCVLVGLAIAGGVLLCALDATDERPIEEEQTRVRRLLPPAPVSEPAGATEPARLPATPPAAVAKPTDDRRTDEKPIDEKVPIPESVVPIGSEHDFGFLAPGARREVLLTLPNPCSDPVRILRIRTGCPCAKAKAPKDSFAPRERLAVRLVFVAPEKRQRYAKRVYVETSDPKFPLRWILVKADVGLPLAVEPALPDFGVMPAGTTKEVALSILNRAERPVRLLYSMASLKGCALKAPGTPIPAGGRMNVPVLLNGASAGPKTVRFDVATDLPDQQNLTVTVRFEVLDPRS
ncbi:MAG: DUF1573 domain-containing protein [Planctomycetota bacterium]